MKTHDEFTTAIRETFKDMDVGWMLMKRAVLKVVDAYCAQPEAGEYQIQISESDVRNVFEDFNSIPLFSEVLKEIGIPVKGVSMQGTNITVSM